MPNIVFSPPPGIFTDDTSFSSDGKWISGSNVRPWNGQMQVIGGWLRRTAQLGGGNTTASTCNAILEWKSNNGTSYVAYGFGDKLFVETANVLYDITPTGTFTTANWTFQTWGETLLANPSGGKLYQWSLNTVVDAAEITQAPDNITTILVTPERQCLALGCNEEGSGTFNPRCVRGCDLEDLTDWTTTTTNNAFEHILDGAASGIVAAALVGTYVAALTSSELFEGQYIGDPSQTYRFDRRGSNCGAVGLKALVSVNGILYYLAPEIVPHMYVPGANPVEIACPVINYFRTQMAVGNTDKTLTFASHVAAFDEIWFNFYKTSGSFVGKSVAFSMPSGLWFIGSTDRAAMHQGLSNVIAVDNGGNLLNCETGLYGDSASSSSLSWHLYSADYFMNKGQTRMMFREAWLSASDSGLSIAASGNINMVLKTSEYPQGNEVTQPTIVFTGSTTKKNFRASGRLFRAELSGSDLDTNTATFMRFGNITFDAVALGKR